MSLRLPKSVESDQRGPQLLRNLTTHTRLRWQGSDIGIPLVGMTVELAEALRNAYSAGRVFLIPLNTGTMALLAVCRHPRGHFNTFSFLVNVFMARSESDIAESNNRFSEFPYSWPSPSAHI